MERTAPAPLGRSPAPQRLTADRRARAERATDAAAMESWRRDTHY
jgi:hypothetical protein